MDCILDLVPRHRLSAQDQELLDRMNERIENMTDEEIMDDFREPPCCEEAANWDGKEPTTEEILKCGESVLKAFGHLL